MDIMLQRIIELIGYKHGAKKELASALGINQNIITSWISGRTKTYKDYSVQIAKFYKVSLDWLSGLTDDKEQKEKPAVEDSEFERVFRMFKDLPIEKKEEIIRYMEFVVSQEKNK